MPAIVSAYHNLALSHVALIVTLGHCAKGQKVAGSRADELIGCFNLANPSSRAVALGSTQPLTGMSTRNPPLR
jgi:hypothetical protein